MSYRKALPGSTTRGMIAPAAGIGPQPKSQQQSANEAQQMLASFGSRILEMLRAGGEKFQGMDRAYADAIEGNRNIPDVLVNSFNSTPLGYRNPLGSEISMDGYVQGPRTLQDAVEGRNLDRLVNAGNIASRYALPAGGVTLAGKGLGDIIAALSSDEGDERY